MKTNEISVRDPFVLLWEDQYYLYGTRAETTFTDHAEGIDVYVSKDLEEWSAPVEVFHRPEGFWADRCFWAPEVHQYQDRFYMFATFGDEKGHLGTAVLVAKTPLGTFEPLSPKTLTPEDWRCLDGTLYLDREGAPYLVFCHEWIQVQDGTICAARLSEDLSHRVEEPFELFSASMGKPQIHSLDGKNWVTDGPFLLRTADGRLHMLWSSFGEGGYVQAMAHSTTEEIDGQWTIDEQLLYASDGGHGMIFRRKDGTYMLTLHTPNTNLQEHPVFIPLHYENGRFTEKMDKMNQENA